MSAEQFWQQWITDDLLTRPAMELASSRAKRFAEAYAAAQLAEKEREIARLKAWKESHLKVTPDWQKIGELLNVGLGQSVTENITPAITDLRDRLRQREAELRQLREQMYCDEDAGRE